MKLFEYAAILHPTKKDKEDGKPSQILIPPTHCLAHDILKDDVLDKLDRVEVAVRPF
jgi:hypothetical protein